MSTLESILSNTSRPALGSSVISAMATQMQGKLVQKLDGDGDGQVNQSEFQAALDKLSNKLGMPVTEDAQALFAGADSDGDGLLGGGELGNLLVGMLQATSSEGTVASFGARSAAPASAEDGLFSRLDTDGNGQLSRAEFMEGVNQSRARMEPGEAMSVHRFASFSTFSMSGIDGMGGMGGMSGMGGMAGWMPTSWASAMQGFQLPSSYLPPVSASGAQPAAATTASPAAAPAVASSATAAPEAGTPADALNAMLAGADSDQDGQISATEMTALLTQLGSQLEAAARLAGRMGPIVDGTNTAQA